MQEEYACSGHTFSDMNKHAKGCIETTAAMNAPAGLALAGYTNCRMRPVPYGFGCLGDADAPDIKRL